MSRRVLIKSRNRIYGRRATEEEITNEIAKMAASGLPMLEIVEQTGEARTTVWRHLKEAEKKGLIEKTVTGRIKLSEQVIQEREYIRLELDEFVKKYPAVETWVNDLRTRKDGRPLVVWKTMLSNLKTVCDTLELSPPAIIAGTDNSTRMASCKRTLQEFALAVQKGQVKYAKRKNKRQKMTEAGLRNYRLALRNFDVRRGCVPARHVGAHYWLARPEVNYNHTLVAKIGGWKSPPTLIDCYGELPEEFVIQKLTGGLVAVPPLR